MIKVELTADELTLIEFIRKNPDLIPYAIRLSEEFLNKCACLPAQSDDTH